jgi:hypothetical protein
MRKPSLSFDTFVAALAVLGVSASAGCGRADRGAMVAPEPAAAASPAPNAPNTEGAGATGAVPAATPQPPAAAAPALPAPAAVAEKPGQAAVADDEKKAAPAPARAANGRPIVGATAVDAGANKPSSPAKSQMSCGAGGCTADMKKGTGN